MHRALCSSSEVEFAACQGRVYVQKVKKETSVAPALFQIPLLCPGLIFFKLPSTDPARIKRQARQRSHQLSVFSPH